MTAEPILDTVTAAHLTEVLRQAGALRAGAVRAVSVERARPTLVSEVAQLLIEYDAEDAGPASVFFKRPLPDGPAGSGEAAQREMAFYAGVGAATPRGLLPRCFEAAPGTGGRSPYLLLEDLTDSHAVVGEWPLPPPVATCEAIVDTVARFHAFWWNHPSLGTPVAPYRDAVDLDRFRADLARRVASFVEHLGDRLSPDRRLIYERFVRSLPRLLERYRSRRHLTIVHGDAHVWNLLVPRDRALRDIRLIDWEGWHPNVATNDLAYMMALHWYPERRRLLEQPLLRRYHDGIVAAGVTGYSFDALWEDYRLSALRCLTRPVWQQSLGLGAWIWWSHLERGMLAVDDLGCRDLLD